MENVLSKIESSIKASLNPVSFVEGFFDASVQTPWNGIAQLTNNSLPQMKLVESDDQSLARTVGSITGAAIDMMLLGKLTSKVASPLFPSLKGNAHASARLGMDGVLFGGLLTPSDDNKGVLEGRMENAITSGATFAAMGGANRYLEKRALFGSKSLKADALTGIASGSVGGVTSSLAQVLVSDQKLSRDDIATNSLKMAAFGGIFGVIGGTRSNFDNSQYNSVPDVSERVIQEHPERLPSTSSEYEMAKVAAARVLEWHKQIDPRIGVHLADPNVVLTLADARGQTEFYIDGHRPEDVQAVEKLDQLTQKDGIRFNAVVATGARGETMVVNVHSLAGTETVSSSTKLPGVDAFKNNSADLPGSWAELGSWFEQSLNGVQKAIDDGQYPRDSEAIHILLGVVKGYPDEAIASLSVPRRQQLTTYVPFSDYYPCAEPNYSYTAEARVVVEQHVKSWGEILEHFYESPEHIALRKDAGFVAAAKAELNRSLEFFDRRLDNSPRLAEFDFPD